MLHQLSQIEHNNSCGRKCLTKLVQALVCCLLTSSLLLGRSSRANERLTEEIQSKTSSTVGIEAVYLLRAGRGDLQAASPVDSKVVLRIADINRDANQQFLLELRYIGMYPGKYDLRDFLRQPNGEGLSDQDRATLEPAMVEVSSVLPSDHDGKLTEVAQPALPWVWPYRKLLVTACLAWFLLPVVWWMVRKRNAEPIIEQPVAVAPSLADRMRPLVTAAMEGRASVQSQAELERLLLTFWRGRLNLMSTSAEENLLQMKCHPEAGKLLRELERWLYHPPGKNQVDLQRLLAPYAEVPP